MPTISRFDGGLVTAIDKVYLGTNQASTLLNADIDKIGLQSALKPKLIGGARKSFYQFPILNSEPEILHVTSSNNKRSYAEFQGALCYSDGGPICKMTTGSMDGDEFNFVTLGIDAAEGEIVARVLDLSDIAGASMTLTIYSSSGTGYITESEIRYRIVDSSGIVYTHHISNNTGYATVAIVLPDNTYDIYREVLDAWGNYTDKFLLVGTGPTFTDGLSVLTDDYEFIEPKQIANYAGHRLSLLGGKSYSSPYNIVVTEESATLVINKLYYLENGTWNYDTCEISITVDDVEDINSIASTFTFNGKIYVMAKLNSMFNIYESPNTLVFESTSDIDQEFFKGTTVEYGSKLYMFNPRDGKIGIFDGSTFTIEDTQEFPYALAQDSIFTLKEGTSEVYFAVNGRHNATIRMIDLDTLVISFVGGQRISLPTILGLGGTSGSTFTQGDFQLMPTSNGVFSFSPTTNQVISNENNNFIADILNNYKSETLVDSILDAGRPDGKPISGFTSDSTGFLGVIGSAVDVAVTTAKELYMPGSTPALELYSSDSNRDPTWFYEWRL